MNYEFVPNSCYDQMYIVEISKYQWELVDSTILDIVKTKEEAESTMIKFIKKYGSKWKKSGDNLGYEMETDSFDYYIYYYEHKSFENASSNIAWWFK